MLTNLRAIRLAKGLTQVQLAAASGVPQSTISDAERGDAPGITHASVLALAKALGVSVDDLDADLSTPLPVLD